METSYDVEEWATATTRGRNLFNYNFHLLGSDFRRWDLLKVVAMKTGQVPDEKTYLWKSKRDVTRNLVE